MILKAPGGLTVEVDKGVRGHRCNAAIRSDAVIHGQHYIFTGACLPQPKEIIPHHLSYSVFITCCNDGV